MDGSSDHGSRHHPCLIIGGIITLILFEIKREIREIEKKLDNPRFGLEEIKCEIREIEAKLDNPHFGLEEIKREIREIETEIGGSSVLTTVPIL
jgi:predicted  nucleic acid-binding Zn-ribbon protein